MRQENTELLANTLRVEYNQKTERRRLTDRDYEECVTKRGLNPEWIEVNCRSMSISDASARLGYTAKSVGIWLESVNGFGQFRPNNAWKNDLSEKKAPKYRTATGEKYDTMLPRHPHNPDYWDDLETLKALAWQIDGHPCLLLTEGMFKAISGCSNDIPTVAIAGVQQGLTPSKDDPQGKRYLVETLERLCREGFGWIIAFDADAFTNSQIRDAQRTLAQQLAKFKVPVYIATGLWSIDQGKGMDDYILNNGAEQFKREVMGKVVDLATWEKQFQDNNKNLQELPPRNAAQELAGEYRTQWKYDLEKQTWRFYNEKFWEPTPDKIFEKAVYHDLEGMPNVSYKTFSYVENVCKFLGVELLERKWSSRNRAEWIAFNDFVLEVSTGLRHEHCPGFMFTSCLDLNCPDLKLGSGDNLLELLLTYAPTFYNWAMYAQDGDPAKILKLLAIFNGVLTYKFSDLQMFTLLCGVPGSGKGTFSRLVEKAVGKNNHASAKLHRLSEDNVIANIIDKQLVVCPDEKKQTGDNSGILTLTGGDNIPYRQLYRPMANARFDGSLMVLANSNPFVGDTIGIDRRWTLVQFNNPLPDRDSAVERKMQLELGAIMALAISMPDKQARNLIRGVGEGLIPDFKRTQWLHKTENDSIALFMEEMLISVSSDKYTMLGGKGDDPTSLYGAYMRMCEENNTRNLYTKNNFRSHLLEVCRSVGWSVKESRCGNGWRVYGISIRGFSDSTPRISDCLGQVQTQCRESQLSVDPSVDLKPLLDKDSVGSVDQNLPKEENQNHHQPIHDEKQDSMIDSRSVYTPTLPLPDKDSSPTLAQRGSTLAQQILALWDDQQALGKIILDLADTEELRLETRNYTHEQLQHIKDAANSAWKIRIDAPADYSGELVYIWEFGQSNDVRIGTKTKSTISVRRANLRPWLGQI